MSLLPIAAARTFIASLRGNPSASNSCYLPRMPSRSISTLTTTSWTTAGITRSSSTCITMGGLFNSIKINLRRSLFSNSSQLIKQASNNNTRVITSRTIALSMSTPRWFASLSPRTAVTPISLPVQQQRVLPITRASYCRTSSAAKIWSKIEISRAYCHIRTKLIPPTAKRGEEMAML